MTFLVNPEKLGHLDLLFSSMFFVCSLVGGLGFRAWFFFFGWVGDVKQSPLRNR